jgi:hypothetical protein
LILCPIVRFREEASRRAGGGYRGPQHHLDGWYPFHHNGVTVSDVGLYCWDGIDTPRGGRALDHVYRQFAHYVTRVLDRMGPQEWLLVLAVAIVIGVVCMRGFGSRSQY